MTILFQFIIKLYYLNIYNNMTFITNRYAAQVGMIKCQNFNDYLTKHRTNYYWCI